VNCLPNFEQPKTPNKTDRNEATQDLAKNTMNTWSAGSLRTGRHAQIEQLDLENENENATSPIRPRISQTA
jgi:hypothetical protein